MRKEHVAGFNDTTLSIGMNVIYPGRRGSSLWLSQGTITEIGHQPTYNGGFDYVKVSRKANSIFEHDGRVVQLTRLDLIIPVS
jgi:hypothetical protein